MQAQPQKRINIIGAGGFGQEVVSMLPYCNCQLADVYDDDLQKPNLKGRLDQIAASKYPFVIAIGDSILRRTLFDKLPQGLKFANLLHSHALLQDEKSIEVGEGSILTAGSIFTTNIQLGKHNIVNLNCTVGHGVTTGDFCSLMPAVNLGGEVTLEEGVYMGTGASVLPGINIGAWSIVGAGAVVTKDIPPHTTVKGVPAR